MVFALSATQAIAKVEKHCGAVLSKLQHQYPGKQLHEIPFRKVVTATALVLEKHPDFKLNPQDGQLEPIRGRSYLYSSYEVGQTMYLHVVASQLKAEQLLPSQHEEIFKNAMGKLFSNPPHQYRKAQSESLEELVKKLGEEKSGKLLNRAYELWGQYGNEWADMHLGQNRKGKKAARLPEKIRKRLGDIFGNPASHHVFLSYYRRENSNPLDSFRAGLKELTDPEIQESSAYSIDDTKRTRKKK